MSTNWTLRGEYAESCNCDYLCPCIFTNPQGEATHDHCYAFLVFRIDEGRFDSTDLSGLAFALVIRSGKVMADGDWVFAGVVDAGGNADQRNALRKIVAGEAGGTPGLIRDHLVRDFRGVEEKPIDFTMDGHRRTVTIPDVLNFDIEGVLSRNQSGEPFYIDNTSHPANSRLALARSNETHLTGFGLGLSMSGAGNNGHFAPFSWSNS
jgi:hypothetical protein